MPIFGRILVQIGPFWLILDIINKKYSSMFYKIFWCRNLTKTFARNWISWFCFWKYLKLKSAGKHIDNCGQRSRSKDVTKHEKLLRKKNLKVLFLIFVENFLELKDRIIFLHLSKTNVSIRNLKMDSKHSTLEILF